MNVLEYLNNATPITVEIRLSGAGVTGLATSDVTFTFFSADGVVGSFGDGQYTLTEVDAAEYPGRYLVTEYPVEDDPSTFLTKFPGLVGLKWAGTGFDTEGIDVRVAQELYESRRIHARTFQEIRWNPDEERWDLFDQLGVLVGFFPALDVSGNAPVIDGTHPVTTLKFVPDPSYVGVF